MEIYTSRLWLKDPDVYDITIKSGDKMFAPTWDMVMGFKDGKITWFQYQEMYCDLMWDSWCKNKDYWKRFAERDRVVFTCFCIDPQICHRSELARYFTSLNLGVYQHELWYRTGK